MKAVADIAKNISEIFNSTLSLKLKYDKTAELLSNVFNSRSVSLLIYDSKLDSLVCQGFHLNTDGLNIEDKKLNTMLQNIGVYNFLRHKRYEKSDCKKLYRDFIKTNNFSSVIDEDEFSNIYLRYADYIQLYDEYKKIIREDQYKINNSTISGLYFKELLAFDSEYTQYINITELSKFDIEEKQCCEILQEKLGIKIETNGFYLGLPMYATERYFGIIRFLFPSRKDFFIKSQESFSLDKVFSERFNYLSQIISLHVETTYYLDGYKKLSTINDSISSLDNLDSACELICDVVNCNGGLIRLQNLDEGELKIKGNTRTLKKYVKDLETFDDKQNPDVRKFSKSLASLFYEDLNIVAVSFNTNSEKLINIFRQDETAELEVSIETIELIEFQSKKYLDLLDTLQINQIAVVNVPNVNSGYMTFTNTSNRKFIAADIEMLVLAVKNVGLEIKHIVDTLKLNKQQLEIAQTESMRNVVHQVGAPLNAISLHLNNIIYKRVPESVVYDRMIYTFHMIKNSLKQLKRFQRILELDTQPIELKKIRTISLARYLINKSIEFQLISKSKGITIHVFSLDKKDDYNLLVDEELFDEVITILVDNAAKYAFSEKELLKNNIKFDPSNLRTDGNILISFSKAGNELSICITNWGAVILPNETESIFWKHYRGQNANEFTPVGSGIGLYLAKKILNAMKANIEVESIESKTTFTITIKNVI